MRLIDADELEGHIKILGIWDEVENKDVFTNDIKDAILKLIEAQPTAYDPDKVVEQLKAASYERYGNDGMGGELVINFDDVVEIMKGRQSNLELECKWKLEDAEVNLYVTGCENRQFIFEGTPEEDGYRYCPYCGRKIKEVE